MFKETGIKNVVIASLTSALTCVLAMFTIPIGIIPITLANIGVYFSGALAGAFYGAFSQVIYLLLVLIGLPFTGKKQGGVHVILGPTGGYMIGYIAMAFFTGFIYKKMAGKSTNSVVKMLWFFVGAVVGTIACYLFGTLWFCKYSNTKFLAALNVCVYPFIIGDLLKIVFVMVLLPRVEKALKA